MSTERVPIAAVLVLQSEVGQALAVPQVRQGPHVHKSVVPQVQLSQVAAGRRQVPQEGQGGDVVVRQAQAAQARGLRHAVHRGHAVGSSIQVAQARHARQRRAVQVAQAVGRDGQGRDVGQVCFVPQVGQLVPVEVQLHAAASARRR